MKYFLIAILLILSSCSKENISYQYPQNPDIVRKNRAGKFFDKNVKIFGKDSSQAQENKANNRLWKASLEVISELLPIAISDPMSKMIVSEWHESEKDSNIRTKINLLVLGEKPAKENLKITIFKQKRNPANQEWQDYQEFEKELFIKLLQDKILNIATSANP